MKKLLLPIIATVMLLSGCSEKAHMTTWYYNVHQNEWIEHIVLNPDDNTYSTDYYYAAFRNEDITPDVMINGAVLVYFIDSDGRDNLLPYESYLLGGLGPYQEMLEYQIEEGVITFIIKSTDFLIGQTVADLGTMKFKVVVLSSY